MASDRRRVSETNTTSSVSSGGRNSIARGMNELSLTIDAALGKRPLDLVVRGANLVNVFTAECHEADIGIWRGRIVTVGELPGGAVARSTRVLDWSGRCLVPGFLDPHFHIGGTQLAVTQLARVLLRHGTTTIASDFQEIYAYGGPRGVRFVLNEAHRAGLRILFVPPAHLLGIERQGDFRHPIDAAEMEAMLDWPEAVGINEPPPAQVLGKNLGVLRLLAAAQARKQMFPGHLPGVHGAQLQAYTAAGASSCHESTNADQAHEKLRLGLWAMMRQGSAGPDMPRILPLFVEKPGMSRWAMVASDEQDVTDLLENGNVNHKLRLAVGAGVDPIAAVQMGTVNPALYYRVDDRLGSVAPGRAADLVAVEDLTSFRVTDVIAGGRIVVRDQKISGEASPTYPSFLRSAVRWSPPLTPEDFRVSTKGSEAHVRVIGVSDGSFVSEKLEATVPVVDGNARPVAERDVLKIAVVNRHARRPSVLTGFVNGLELVDGAVASTYCHVHYHALVIGTSEEQMAIAADALREMQGGVAVVSGRKVIARWSLPLVGVFATEPPAQAARNLTRVNQALKKIGCAFASPVLGLSFVALTTIPHYGMTERGLYDVDEKRFVPVLISSPK
jgi:adenine deaminase